MIWKVQISRQLVPCSIGNLRKPAFSSDCPMVALNEQNKGTRVKHQI